MRTFDHSKNQQEILTPEILQMVAEIYEHKGKQELFVEANVDELSTLLEVAKIQSTGASNRIEGIFTTEKRLEELVRDKAEPRNRSEQEIAGYREVLSALQESSTDWQEGGNVYAPFVKYYLGVILKSYHEFENRVEHLKDRTLLKPDRIRYVIDQKLGKITKKDIMEKSPDISKVTVERTLTELVKTGYISKTGAGPSTAYVKNND